MNKTQWKDLSPGTRRLLTLGTIIQIALLGAAHLDLTRRSADEIRGKKGVWRALTLINFVGPIMYFIFGRRKHPH